MSEDKIQNPGEFLFRFTLEGCVMDQRSGDGRWVEKSKIIAIISGYWYPEFWKLGARIASERGSVSTRKTDRFHDLQPLSSHWCSWYRSWLCGFMLFQSSKWGCSGLRYEMGWNSIIYDQDPTGWYLGQFVQIEMPNYQRLNTMVKRSIDQKLRLRNFDARHLKIETGAAVTSRRGFSGIEREKGVCYRREAKGQCSRGDQCSFGHEGHESAKPTPKTAPSSEPPAPRGRSASRKRSLRGWSPSRKFDRQPCKDYLKGIYTNSPCDCGHPPECQFC